jgi:hypothetical protein
VALETFAWNIYVLYIYIYIFIVLSLYIEKIKLT